MHLLLPIRISMLHLSYLVVMWSTLINKFGVAFKYSIFGYCSLHCISEYLLDITRCTGPSMQPTIYHNDIMLTEHVSTHFFHNIHRNDIVVLRSPYEPNKLMCKRVVRIAYDEMPSTSWPFLRQTQFVPKGHVWVEGDNQTNSKDSKDLGPIPVGLLRSRVVCRIWPRDRIGFIL
ncbi:mitochondrial inner membrane protease subunit 1-like [Anneissia japonica]|uniref:mitochondrial inner membrane protease subunit 1-like n=1 Tax=Anneissia japonica TaxID=1529436 RepID=UPI0014258FA2|nr:mitochondrial inner membrane protease subunit 1-like [Anneissia japonica]